MLGGADIKDTTLKVLVGVLVSSIGWFVVWAQDVATKGWVKSNPPILSSIPEIRQAIPKIEVNSDNIETLERDNIRTVNVLENLNRTVSDLRRVVRELTKEVSNLKIEIVKLRK